MGTSWCFGLTEHKRSTHPEGIVVMVMALIGFLKGILACYADVLQHNREGSEQVFPNPLCHHNFCPSSPSLPNAYDQ